MDEVKLMTSYIPFLTKDSIIVKSDNKWTYPCFAVQADVRLQIPKLELMQSLQLYHKASR